MKKGNNMIGLKNASKSFEGRFVQRIAAKQEEYFRPELERGSKRMLLPCEAVQFF